MSNPTKKQKTSQTHLHDPQITDPRFANIQSDPRYRLPGKKNKVKVDKRFARLLEDEDFTKRAKVDRYGRPVKSHAEQNRLKRKYEFGDDDEDNSANKDDDDDDQADDDQEVQAELNRVSASSTRDILRQGLDSDSSSTSSDSDTDEDSDLDEDDDEQDAALSETVGLGASQQSNIPMGDVTSRIAVVNLDWDNIRAADLMAVFTSFLPPSGAKLLTVSIYPSEFGKERLEREEMEGPPREIFAANSNQPDEQDEDEDDEQDQDIKESLIQPDEGAEFDSAALRAYQLERLRYYYAILTFSSSAAAKHIYDAVDGTEYLTTANFFDLRFVPDDTDFSTDTPRESCDRIPDDYRPNDFVTDALQHSKVKLTWDAEDGGRKETIARAFRGGRKEIDENDLKAYLASDSSDSEDDYENEATVDESAPQSQGLSKKEAERQKMRALLGLAPEPIKPSKKDQSSKAPVGDMQVTFTSGFSASAESGKKRSVFENSPEPDETTMEKYIRKEKERKAKRKEKQRVSKTDEDDQGDDSGAKTAMNPEADQEDDEAEDLGFDDPFFAAPDSASAGTAAKQSSSKLRKEERLKKRREREAEEEIDKKQRAQLELLMTDDTTSHGKGSKSAVRHFDMKAIEKAEKEEKKRGKKGQKAKSKESQDGPGDDFKMDTADPRFARLFDNHEYAIDPTNPRFKGTKAMKEVLDEGRKRKSDQKKNKQAGPRTDLLDPDQGKKGRNKDKKANNDHGSSVSDVKSLVDKIKSKSRG
ncbi:hypothetical protein B0A52_09005 [Exophiala mesophila]|uniref:Uncharacterized protein n=1 Tax=Exophiala mesophila TaxID=212818 RepID=A0A438MVK0_EXOME|nr:hypothetical protein B0A52_09005 [Exophiala mesophila]